MKTRKFKKFIISDEEPKMGNTMVCVQKKNINFGKTTIITIPNGKTVLDTKNWKVIVQPQQYKIGISGNGTKAEILKALKDLKSTLEGKDFDSVCAEKTEVAIEDNTLITVISIDEDNFLTN